MGSLGTGERAELGAWPRRGRKAQGEAAESRTWMVGTRDRGAGRAPGSPSCIRPSSLGFPSPPPFQTRGTNNICLFHKRGAVTACLALFRHVRNDLIGNLVTTLWGRYLRVPILQLKELRHSEGTRPEKQAVWLLAASPQ